MKIFVIDFSKDKSLIEMCLNNGNIVEYEQKDGALAYSKTREFMPDLIVVNYKDKPSHGRITAQKIKQRKITSEIPVYFIDGTESEIYKIKGFGIPKTKSELEKLLKNE